MPEKIKNVRERTVVDFKRQSKVVTTNPIYRCEELEDVASIYDEIEQNVYVDSNEQGVYLDIIADETEECDQGSTPQLPSPRPVTESQDQKPDNGYEALNKEASDHVYLHVINDEIEGCETEGCDQDTAAENKD